MKQEKKVSFKNVIRQIRAEGISMRRRFTLYIISAIILVLSLILLLLNWFGNINPAYAQITGALDTQLISYTDSIRRDYDKAAAHAISFSEQLEEEIQHYLTENNLSFADLKKQFGRTVQTARCALRYRLSEHAAHAVKRRILYSRYHSEQRVRSPALQRNLSQIHQSLLCQHSQ